jgi:hypothetical protein
MKHLLPFIFFIFTACSRGDIASQQANFVTKLFMDTCAAHLGDNKALSAWIQKNKYERADEQFSKAALEGKSGEVWGPINSIGQFLVVLTGDTQCAAWARTANSALVNQHFETYVKGVTRPGLTVTPHVDKYFDGAGGKYRQFGFLLQKDGAPHGWLMLATTSESKQAEVQVRLTVSPVIP